MEATTSASFLSEQLATKKNRKRLSAAIPFKLGSVYCKITLRLFWTRNVVNTFTTILVVSNWQAARTSLSENSLH